MRGNRPVKNGVYLELGPGQRLDMTEDIKAERLLMHPSAHIERNGFSLDVSFVDIQPDFKRARPKHIPFSSGRSIWKEDLYE